MSIIDIEELGNIGKSNSIITMIDSTFASPYNQNPINMGIDVVIHSATKYLGGHSDIIAGSITSADKDTHKQIFQTLKLFGGTLSPFDSFLLARGIKTLDVRMERHNENGITIANFLENHSKIERVFYPGLSSHAQHDIAKKQMRGFGGMIAFEVKGGAAEGQKVIENLDVIVLAVSLGGVESLVEQASTMTHSMVSREDRLKGGITDGLIRFSVGLESTKDLKNDLSKALELI
jgi:cystathionine beta-lyase/cystathionine gamma-synthase